ncbi:HTTM domain-containing protein [Nesterenkonia sp. HG001]|uniref:HTTM domain-containing protein n=1 Tax=Nesterenkonia sp. HG001 TaxID=2983207 RepID=UPI002AC73A43|nr:HTTM domain-containing protein [Nesterenkonia sp. HG001]MDZ5077443.1 HTTM domain-containing protein [Nesterenkonia sp. HG001]
MTTIRDQLLRPIQEGTLRSQGWLLLRKNALYGLSATRILVGVAMLGVLLTNFGSRHVLWGVGSFWAEPYRETNAFGGLVDLFGVESPALFTLMYLALIGVAVAVIIGWRTRLTTLLLALGMAALVERASPMGDQGDNIARIGLLLMVLMSTAEHWSLDARRRRLGEQRAARGELSVGMRLWHSMPVLPAWWTNLLHNGALIALACQIFILYTASALYKVQGSTWQAGTALYYPLSLHEYGVFPWLNSLVTGNPVLLTTLTYFSVYVQLFFAVGLLHPVTRRLALIGIVLLHGGIAVMMGLPWFSLAMLAFDAIFVSDRTYRFLERLAAAAGAPLRARLPGPLKRLLPPPQGQSDQTSPGYEAAAQQGELKKQKKVQQPKGHKSKDQDQKGKVPKDEAVDAGSHRR